jgi:multiple sugar transport system ATP-binding protein
VVGIRPEDLPAARVELPGTILTGEVELVEALGSELLIHFRTDARVIPAESLGETRDDTVRRPDEPGSSVDSIARVEPRYDVRAGEHIAFAVCADRLEFFDLRTGEAIWK